MMQRFDLVVIGGGIVGLATAFRFLERFPGRSVAVLEKESEVARHQTGHNSGVLHSGIYYRPGSLRAQNCRTGKRAMEEFCEREGIPIQHCGKVIVAVDEFELPRLEKIHANGLANGVLCTRIGAAELRELEPHCAGVAAIHVPEAGIVDFIQVARRLATLVANRGGSLILQARVYRLSREPDQVFVCSTAGEFCAKHVVNCAGLHSDRVSRLSGRLPESRIISFRGEYYGLCPAGQHLVRALIYPVPNPEFPFLGVHFTRRIDGGIECGPNAVLAWAREGYRHRDINLRDLAEWSTYSGFWRMVAKYWRTGLEELYRSFSKAAFVRALQRLVPGVESEHLHWTPAGVRAQAVSTEGRILDDWVIHESHRIVNVENAPSPAATASLNIGRIIVDRIASQMD